MRITRYLHVSHRRCYHGLLSITLLLLSLYLLVPRNYYTDYGRGGAVQQELVQRSKDGRQIPQELVKVSLPKYAINMTLMEETQDTSEKFSATSYNSSTQFHTNNRTAVRCNQGTCFEDLTLYKLPRFDKRFKNPCFYEEVGEDDSDQSVYKNLIIRRMVARKDTPQVQSFHQYWQKRRRGKQEQLRCLPYFFLIGMEKCGTTDLYQRISIHPHIVLSPAKELQWWTRRRFFYQQDGAFPGKQQSDEYKLRHKGSLVNVPLKHYYAFFDKAAEAIGTSVSDANSSTPYHHMITGDGSPNVIYWNDFAEIFSAVDRNGPKELVAHQLASLLPESKFICILREPTDRLYSSYLFFNRGVTRQSFHNAVTKGIELFNDCVHKYSLRYCTYSWELKERVGSTVNLMQGIYSVMVRDWLQVFNRSQFHVVHFETYKKKPLEEVNSIFKFLDIPTLTADSIEAQRIAKKSPSFVGKQYRRVGGMLEVTRTLLNKFYSRFNGELAALLDDDRFLWIK